MKTPKNEWILAFPFNPKTFTLIHVLLKFFVLHSHLSLSQWSIRVQIYKALRQTEQWAFNTSQNNLRPAGYNKPLFSVDASTAILCIPSLFSQHWLKHSQGQWLVYETTASQTQTKVNQLNARLFTTNWNPTETDCQSHADVTPQSTHNQETKIQSVASPSHEYCRCFWGSVSQKWGFVE